MAESTASEVYKPLPVFDGEDATPLLKLANTGKSKGVADYITIAETFTGVHIFGSTGSAKTSGSGNFFARSMLYNNYGGVVFTVKVDEAATWSGEGSKTGRYTGHIRAADREAQEVIFSKGSGYTFNPFQYLKTYRPEFYQIDFLCDLVREIYRVVLAAKGQTPSKGGSSEFWDGLRDDAIRQSIGLLLLADQEINLLSIGEIIQTMPATPEAAAEFLEKWNPDDPSFYEWLKHPDLYALRLFALSVPHDDEEPLTEQQEDMMTEVRRYMFNEFPTMPSNYRGTIKQSFKNMANPFKDRNGVLYKHFSKGVSEAVCPEKCYEDGAIIVLDFPTDGPDTGGAIIQNVYRMIWQKVLMNRNAKYPDQEGFNNRPVFLWMDECSKMVTPSDGDFFSKCRQQRVACVLLNQTLRSYYAKMQSTNNSKHETESFLDNLLIHVVHQVDAGTAAWAAERISKDEVETTSSSFQAENGRFSSSTRQQEKYICPPAIFINLKRGGLKNDLKTEAIIILNNPLNNGRRFAKVIFDQTNMNR